MPRGLQWAAVVGPGVIVLGASIGSGEFILGPAAFVRYGLPLLWITLVATLLQTIFNTELMRYTLATGEPVFTGFMRTRPSAGFWSAVYVLFILLQVGWPAWAATAAGAVFFVMSGQLAGPADAGVLQLYGTVAYLLCMGILLVGRRIERTLEILNWVLVSVILLSLLVLCLRFVDGPVWLQGLGGLIGFDVMAGGFRFLPAGADFFLLGALAGFSGAGGVINIALSNWARDKGYGMGSAAGHIPSAVGGQRVPLAHSGFSFVPDESNMARWRGWWRIVRADQWGVFFCGALAGMLLPALLYVSFIPAGSDIRGFGIAAALAEAMSAAAGPALGTFVAVMAAWVLFKTQLDVVEGMTRSVTDIIWTGSPRIRQWRNGDVRRIYYAVLAVVVLWGLIAIRLAQPVFLLQVAANMGGLVLMFASLHLLYLNTRVLPAAVRPPAWRRAGLIAVSVFYGVFVSMWLYSWLRQDADSLR